MAILTGDILALNRIETTFHAVGSDVMVRLGRSVIATGKVTDNDDFSIELPDDIAGELEIQLGMHNAAPTLVDYHGQDLHVTLLYSNVNNYFA